MWMSYRIYPNLAVWDKIEKIGAEKSHRTDLWDNFSRKFETTEKCEIILLNTVFRCISVFYHTVYCISKFIELVFQGVRKFSRNVPKNYTNLVL